MAKQEVVLNLLGCSKLQTSAASSRAAVLSDMRAGPSVGEFETFPQFTSSAVSARQYWDGAGIATEAATGNVCGLFRINLSSGSTDLIVLTSKTSSCVSYTQTTTTTQSGLTGGCLMEVNNVTALGLSLGQTVDIEIVTATTFRWRKAGGAWSAGIVISLLGNAIDAGNATLYWLTDTGFNVGDTWVYTRTDQSSVGTVSTVKTWSAFGRVYYTTNVRRVYVAQSDDNAVPYIRSVGYSPTYGYDLIVFENHLIVGQANRWTETGMPTTANLTQNRIIWSDNLDLDDFFPTDVNEADFYEFAVQSRNGSSVIPFVATFTVIRGTLQVWTSDYLYETNYFGLPTVFNFTQSSLWHFNNSAQGVVAAVNAITGVYLLTSKGFYFYNGASVQDLSLVVDIVSLLREATTAGVGGFGRLVYNIVDGEVAFMLSNRMYCYQEKFQTYYQRSIDFDSNMANASGYAFTSLDGSYFVGSKDLKYYVSGTDWTSTVAYSKTAGTAYAKPTVLFELIGQLPFYTKELDTCYLGADCPTVETYYTYYDQGNNVNAKLYWYPVPSGVLKFPSIASYTSAANSIWTPNGVDGLIDAQRTSFRFLSLALEFYGLNSKPVGYVRMASFTALIVNNTPVLDNKVTR